MTAPKIPAPLILAGLAGLALVMMQRRAVAAPASAAASQAARLPVPSSSTRQGNGPSTYANAQTMAELLARSVNTAFGIFSPVPRTAAAVVGTAEARDAIRRSESPGYYGWSGPTITATAPEVSVEWGDPYHGGVLLSDSIVAGPVYDLSTHSNPWAWAEDWGNL